MLICPKNAKQRSLSRMLVCKWLWKCRMQLTLYFRRYNTDDEPKHDDDHESYSNTFLSFLGHRLLLLLLLLLRCFPEKFWWFEDGIIRPDDILIRSLVRHVRNGIVARGVGLRGFRVRVLIIEVSRLGDRRFDGRHTGWYHRDADTVILSEQALI